jgi:hypothetical protein
MLDELLNRLQLLDRHWATVLGVGLLFLVVQLALSLRLSALARRRTKIVKQLLRDHRRRGDGRGDLETLEETFSWVAWASSVFPADAKSPRGAFTRDQALAELDARLAGDSKYLLLQRMGVMAPLLGVVLTVIGFFWLHIDAGDEQSLNSILAAVIPLVSGVGAGAVLALVNQVLLHRVGVRVERLRLSARHWFDAVIWSSVGQELHAGTDNSLAAMERFASGMTAAADRHAHSAERLEATTQLIKHAAAQLGAAANSLHQELEDIPANLAGLKEALTASAAALQDLIPIGTRAVSNLDVSVAAFRSTLDREFTEAAKLYHGASRTLAASVAQLSESVVQLKFASSEIQQQVDNAASDIFDEPARVPVQSNGDSGLTTRPR